MSTKIYIAWEMRQIELPALMVDFREFAMENAIKELARSNVSLERRASLEKARSARGESILDMSLSVYLHDGCAYAIPWGVRSAIEKFVLPKGVADFSYWNNSDAPEGMNEREWESRGEVWKKIDLGLFLSFEGFSAGNEIMLANAVRKAKKEMEQK